MLKTAATALDSPTQESPKHSPIAGGLPDTNTITKSKRTGNTETSSLTLDIPPVNPLHNAADLPFTFQSQNSK